MPNNESSDPKEKVIHKIGDEVKSADWIRGAKRDNPAFQIKPGTEGKIVALSTAHDYRVAFKCGEETVTAEVNAEEIE